jgi:hypothetical protein
VCTGSTTLTCTQLLPGSVGTCGNNLACDDTGMCVATNGNNPGPDGAGCNMNNQCISNHCTGFHCNGNGGGGKPCVDPYDCSNFQCNTTTHQCM